MKNANELINQLHETCKAEGIPLLIMAMPEKQYMTMLKHSPKLEITSSRGITPESINTLCSSVLVDIAYERIVRLLNGERSKHEEQDFEIIEALGIGLRKVEVSDEIH